MKIYSRKIIGLLLWVGVVFAPVSSYAEEENLALIIQQAINSNKLAEAENLLASSDISEFQKGYLAGWLSLKKGNKAQAQATWEELHKSYPSSLELGNNLAVLLIEKAQYEEAQKLLESTLHSDKQVSKALENLRELYGYKAQQAYKKVFSKLDVTKPKGQWLELTGKSDIQLVANEFGEFSEVSQAIEIWRKAWSAKDVTTYLNAYGKDFIPADGQGLKAWQNARKRSLTAPRFIEVKLNNMSLAPLDDTTVRVSFRQNYKSDRFQDEINKVLLLKNTPEGWKIVQEALIYAAN